MSRFLPEIFGIVLTLVCHRALAHWYPAWLRWVVASAVLGVCGLLLNVPYVWTLLPPGPVFTWVRGAAILWGILVCGTTGAVALSRKIERPGPPVDLARRALVAPH